MEAKTHIETKNKLKTKKHPLFLGINCENQADKIQSVIKSAFIVLDDEIGLSKEFITDLEQIMNAFKNTSKNWKIPNSHHVTQLFLGSNKEALDNPIYGSYKERE